MLHWYSDENMAVERIPEIQQQADRVQILGLYHRKEFPVRSRLRTILGHWLIALGQYLQGGKEIHRADLRPSSQCGLR